MNQSDVATERAEPTKTRLEKATVGDIILSIVIPGWGVLIGIIALVKREFKRGLTMIVLGAVMIAIYTALSMYQPH